jgi:hypothetical protein
MLSCTGQIGNLRYILIETCDLLNFNQDCTHFAPQAMGRPLSNGQSPILVGETRRRSLSTTSGREDQTDVGQRSRADCTGMKSSTTSQFWKLYRALPEYVQRRADSAYQLWRLNPYAQALYFKRVGKQQPVYSVRIGLDYRALGLLQRGYSLVVLDWGA